MEKRIKMLGLILGAQLLLAVGLQWAGPSLAISSDRKPFLSASIKDTDALLIEGPEKKAVRLIKKNGAWLVQDPLEFPAEEAKLQSLLDKLGELKRGAPVAQSQDAGRRFKVSDDDFEKRLTLKKGEKELAVVYFGTSPSFKTVHARLKSSQDIYSVDYSSWDLATEAGDWQNKELLKIPQLDISALEVEGLQMARLDPPPAPSKPTSGKEATKQEAPRWELKNGKGQERLKQEPAEKLASLAAGLRLESVLSAQPQGEYGLDKPVLTWTLTRKNGEKIQHALGKTPGKEEYTLKASNRQEYFRLASTTATALLEAAKRKTLLETK